jgi:hypothetical protein
MLLWYSLSERGRFILLMTVGAKRFHTLEIYLRIGYPTRTSYVTDAIVFIAEYHESFSSCQIDRMVCKLYA